MAPQKETSGIEGGAGAGTERSTWIDGCLNPIAFKPIKMGHSS